MGVVKGSAGLTYFKVVSHYNHSKPHTNPIILFYTTYKVEKAASKT